MSQDYRYSLDCAEDAIARLSLLNAARSDRLCSRENLREFEAHYCYRLIAWIDHAPNRTTLAALGAEMRDAFGMESEWSLPIQYALARRHGALIRMMIEEKNNVRLQRSS